MPERIHLLLAKVELGPFSEQQVRDALEQGLLRPTDPAKYEGLGDWRPVDEVLAKLPAFPPPIPQKPQERVVEAPEVTSILINPFLWNPPEILYKPLFEIAPPITGTISYSFKPSEVLHKPLFEIAAPLAGVIPDSLQPTEVLHKPLFEIAAPLAGVIPDSLKPTEVLHKPLFEIAAPLAGVIPDLLRPAEVVHKPLFEIATPLAGVIPDSLKPAEVLQKPLFEIAEPITWLISDSLKPAEVLHKPLFEMAAPLAGVDSQESYVDKPAEILCKPNGVSEAKVETLSYSVTPAVLPAKAPEKIAPADSSDAERRARLILQKESASRRAEKPAVEVKVEDKEKAFARAVREAYKPPGRSDMPVPTRLLIAKSHARSRTRKGFSGRMRSLLEGQFVPYFFCGIILVGLVLAVLNWSALEPLVSSFWIELNFAIYEFFDDIGRLLTEM